MKTETELQNVTCMRGDNMTDVKAYLKRVKLYDTHINNKMEELDRLNAMVRKITQTLRDDAGGGSRSQDKIGDAVARIVDLQKEINKEIDRFVDCRNEVCESLNVIQNQRYFDVLYKRYVLFKTWPQIAEDMDFKDERGVYKLHGRALQAFNKILFKNGKEKEGMGIEVQYKHVISL